MKRKIISILLSLAIIMGTLPVAAKAAEETLSPTRTELLALSGIADKNEEEGWEWQPDAAGGGTLTLTNCYIRADTASLLSFDNAVNNNCNVTIILKGKNILETTSQAFNVMIFCNGTDTVGDYTIKEEGEGSLQIRTSAPVTTTNSPFGFGGRSVTIESGSIETNIPLAVIRDGFSMLDGSLKIHTPEDVPAISGIYTIEGPVNISGGKIDITTSECGFYVTSVGATEDQTVNISGGDITLNSAFAGIFIQGAGLDNPESETINITGGKLSCKSDSVCLYAKNIHIAGSTQPPQITVSNTSESYPAIMGVNMSISNSIISANSIASYEKIPKEDCIVFLGDSGQLYGNMEITENLTLPEAGSFTATTGSSITVHENAVLTIPDNMKLNTTDGSFINNGTLILPENAGNVNCTGTGIIKRGEKIYNTSYQLVYPVTIKKASGNTTTYYAEGETVTLSPETPPDGMHFKGWKAAPDTIIVTENQFIMPSCAVTLEQIYEAIQKPAASGKPATPWKPSVPAENHLITIKTDVMPAKSGTVSKSIETKAGATVTVKAVAHAGYTFTAWTEDGKTVSTDAEYTFTAKGNRALTAIFKQNVPPNTPQQTLQVENTIKTVSEAPLPNGWVWSKKDGDKTIPAGSSVNATAEYTAGNAADYIASSVTITISRKACEEAPDILFNGTKEHAPSCTTDGLGHTECRLCSETMRDNIIVPATGHTPGVPVTEKATTKSSGSIICYCTVCNAPASNTEIHAVNNIHLSKTTGTYNGKTQHPSVTVKDSNNNPLKLNTDYTLSYAKGMKNPGIYHVMVTLDGNYEGTSHLSYTITPKGTSISKVMPTKKGFTVKWKKQPKQITGYEIQYSSKKNFAKKSRKTIFTKKNKTSKTFTVKKRNKKYYFRIRTYKTIKVNGKNKKITSGWSKLKTVKVK